MAGETMAKKTRGKAGTAPTNAWIRRRYLHLVELLGVGSRERPLPDLDVEAKRLIRSLEEELDRRDPKLRHAATAAQVRRVAGFAKALGVPDPVVDGYLSKADAKAFLDEHAWFVPPTDRQLYAATALATRYEVEIYRERGVMTLGSVSRFLSEYIARANGERVSDGVPDRFGGSVGGYYGELQRAAFAGTGYGGD